MRTCLGYFVWKITILRQQIILFPILGEGGALLDPPLLYSLCFSCSFCVHSKYNFIYLWCKNANGWVMAMVFSSAFDNISAIWWLKTTTTKQTNKNKWIHVTMSSNLYIRLCVKTYLIMWYLFTWYISLQSSTKKKKCNISSWIII